MASAGAATTRPAISLKRQSIPAYSRGNTNWEGEIKAYGDKVNIRLRPDINVSEYTKGQDLDVQTPDQPMTDLQIDRGLYWNFLVEDVDRAQSDLNFLEEWTEDAAEKSNESTNEIVLGEVYSNVHAANQGATAGIRTEFYDLGAPTAPVGLTPANVINYLGKCASVLTEHKVPRRDRWMVLPPWICQLIYESPSRESLIAGNDQDLLRKGHIGKIAGFDIFESNQLAMVDDTGLVTNVIFGHKSAITFASQFVNSEVVQAESKFGRFARGLSVFGFNVVKPEAMGLLYCKPGS